MNRNDICSNTGKLLQAYHDGELPPEKERAVRDHLRQCERCRLDLEKYLRVSELLQKVAAEERKVYASYSWWPRIRPGLLEEIPPLRKIKWRRAPFFWLRPVGAALALSVVLILLAFWPRSKIPPNYCRIENISSPEHQLFIYQGDTSGLTVIWINE